MSADSVAYQQSPAQAARIPTSHSQAQLDAQQSNHISPLQHAKTWDRGSSASLQHAGNLSRESSWPVEGFADLHLAGNEPRIFPGLVSSTRRRDSSAAKRNNPAAEAGEYYGVTGASSSKKGGGRGNSVRGVDGAVEEEYESDEESD